MRTKRVMVSKRAQVTIFIILALAILVVLALFFLSGNNINPVSGSQTSPIDQIKKCMIDTLNEGINISSMQGGSINPELYFNYSGYEVQYLCYTQIYGKLCTVQKPLIKSSFEKEIADYSQAKVEACITSAKDSLVSQGYSVDYKKPNVNVEVGLKNIIISADNLSLEISKSSKETYDSIKAEKDSDFYMLLMTATSITNSEASVGNSESMNYMMHYPSMKVEKKIQSDGTRIYILTDKNTKEVFQFASRSLPLPVVTGN